MKRSLRSSVLLLTLLLLLGASSAEAARIGDLGEVDILEQAKRFLSFRDPAVRYAVFGSVLLGLTCGVLGSFIVVRRLALMGDTLSHAVLPGVVLGFLWNMTKDPVAIFVGATLAGLLGTATVTAITHTTRLKEDTALGMVLAGFFAIGACLLTMTQNLSVGTLSGIRDFLFGQAAAIGPEDLRLMAVIATLVVVTLLLFYKELLVSSFDPAFARLTGIPVRLAHHGLMLLLAFAVVISLQAVGVVLVSAMLIIPAATAYLLTERMSRMLVIAAFLGAFAGIAGAFLSFLGPNLPTGPFMVLASGSLFFAAFLLSPRHGVAVRGWRHMARRQRIERENTLKAIYHIIEGRGFSAEGVSVRELAEQRRETLEETRRKATALRRNGLATLADDSNFVYLTPQGWNRAGAIVRNHRLWELYLTNAVEIAPDHVHEDAERIEHVLGEETVRNLERRLGHATTDPHGKRIPSSTEILQGRIPEPTKPPPGRSNPR
jgi:ABC-type Mn2+/Zn2+ transport system permease subunit/Mn-dependent DtxR family transcriptional regulator